MKKNICFIAAFILLAITHSAYADDNLLPFKVPPVVKSECMECHNLYPPALLPKESWNQIFNGLDKHFGVNASLDDKKLGEISQWFIANAGTYKRVSNMPPNNRITESSWFIRKHNEISANVWTRPSVQSKSNCVACHRSANDGNFDEDYVSIPQ